MCLLDKEYQQVRSPRESAVHKTVSPTAGSWSSKVLRQESQPRAVGAVSKATVIVTTRNFAGGGGGACLRL